MKSCLNCSKEIPNKIVIDGKRINCQRRKYCFECSPFGNHNTSQLEARKLSGSLTKLCIDCNKEHDQKGRRCFVCVFNKRRIEVTGKIQEIVGKSCWICGYDKTWRNIHFHHVDPLTKSMTLTSREYMLKWETVYKEMQKCILVCGNCHGEIHDCLIAEDKIKNLHNEFWKTGM